MNMNVKATDWTLLLLLVDSNSKKMYVGYRGYA